MFPIFMSVTTKSGLAQTLRAHPSAHAPAIRQPLLQILDLIFIFVIFPCIWLRGLHPAKTVLNHTVCLSLPIDKPSRGHRQVRAFFPKSILRRRREACRFYAIFSFGRRFRQSGTLQNLRDRCFEPGVRLNINRRKGLRLLREGICSETKKEEAEPPVVSPEWFQPKALQKKAALNLCIKDRRGRPCSIKKYPLPQ